MCIVQSLQCKNYPIKCWPISTEKIVYRFTVPRLRHRITQKKGMVYELGYEPKPNLTGAEHKKTIPRVVITSHIYFLNLGATKFGQPILIHPCNNGVNRQTTFQNHPPTRNGKGLCPFSTQGTAPATDTPAKTKSIF